MLNRPVELLSVFPNRLHEFYSLLSFSMREIVDKSIFGSSFKCRNMGMSGFLMEHFLDCYQSEGMFSLTRMRAEKRG